MQKLKWSIIAFSLFFIASQALADSFKCPHGNSIPSSSCPILSNNKPYTYEFSVANIHFAMHKDDRCTNKKTLGNLKETRIVPVGAGWYIWCRYENGDLTSGSTHYKYCALDGHRGYQICYGDNCEVNCVP